MLSNNLEIVLLYFRKVILLSPSYFLFIESHKTVSVCSGQSLGFQGMVCISASIYLGTYLKCKFSESSPESAICVLTGPGGNPVQFKNSY